MVPGVIDNALPMNLAAHQPETAFVRPETFGAFEQIDTKRPELLPEVKEPAEEQVLQPEGHTGVPRHRWQPLLLYAERPEQADAVTDPPRRVHVERTPTRKKTLALTAQAEDWSVPAPEPEDLGHLLELAVHRQLRHQQSIGNEHAPIHTSAGQKRGAVKAVYTVARRDVPDAEAQTRSRICPAEGVEPPRFPCQHLTRRPDSSI